MMKTSVTAGSRVALLVSIWAVIFGVVSFHGVAHAGGEPITGVLHLIWGDPPATSGHPAVQGIILTDDQGKSIHLAIDQKILQQHGGIHSIKRKSVTVTGEWVTTPQGMVLKVKSLAVMGPGARAAPRAGVSPLAGSQPWATILCRFADSTGVTPHPSSWFDTLMGTSYPGMDHFWQELSYSGINLSGSVVVGWYNLPDVRSDYLPGGNLDFSKAANDCANAADADVYFPGFVGVNFMFNESLGCCAWGGTAYITADGGGVYSATWMPPWGYQAHGVLAQEMGHGFGLPHSSGPYTTPYDSLWDPMSNGFGSCSTPDPDYGCIGVHTISYHKDWLGWIPPSQRADVNTGTSRTITIERLGQPTNGTDYLMAKVSIGGSSTLFYTVEARRKAGGYDANIPGDAIVIHKVDTTLSDRNAQVVDATIDNNPNDAGAMWTVGESYVDNANNITVTVNSATGTAYNVTISNSVTLHGDLHP